jgi:uncharacterized membrane protein YraQ (UPF0718 family)
LNLVWEYLRDTVLYVLGTLLHNLPALLLGIVVAAAIKIYVDPERMKGWLMKRSAVSIPATVVFGAFTPFCACGTMAVVLSMLATALPWGPIMAFLTSSPLMSPEGFVLISGIISPSFAIALTVASVIIGLGSGYAAHVIEKKTHFLDNQLRFDSGNAASVPAGCACSAADAPKTAPVASNAACCSIPEEPCGCGGISAADAVLAEPCGCGGVSAAGAVIAEPCGCGGVSAAGTVIAEPCGCGVLTDKPPLRKNPVRAFLEKSKIDRLPKAILDIGVKKILPYFAVFAAIGYLINRFIPSAWIEALFGAHSIFAVPLAAVVGLPLYVNGDSSIPLIQSLLQSGVAPGAMLAFLITGPGTSAGVLAGIATIMKKRAIVLYAGFLLAGAILLGYAYELILALVK